ncbi:MAG: NAD-dependent protein deacylase, partial [Clostridia bacterium]|nr:NAD-dependent protein deacylase [Clostridia bacterium]
ITQNIDGLHQAAGSVNVMELHGSVHRNYCTGCGAFYDAAYIKNSEGVPKCEKCGCMIKPDVVLYDEQLNMHTIDRAIDAIAEADTMIVAGTSLTVYPAAGLLRYFRGKNLVLINRDETNMDYMATLVIHDKVGEVLDKIKL